MPGPYSVTTTDVFVARPFDMTERATVFMLPLVVTVQLLV
jgi:hypothetical protein